MFYTIDQNNHLTAFDKRPDSMPDGADLFSSRDGFRVWSREQGAERLQALDELLTGTPAGALFFRNTVADRIWAAITSQNASSNEEQEVKSKSKKKVAASRAPKAKAKKAVKIAKAAKPEVPTAAKEETPKQERAPRSKDGNKKIQAAQLMMRKSGVTAAELKEKLGWNEVSTVFFSQWVNIVLRTGIKSLEVKKNSNGEKVYYAAA